MIKKPYDYFNFFKEMADSGLQSVKYLKGVLENFEYEKLTVYKEEIHVIEHAADMKKHEMMKNLLKEFLPPIDREDIMHIGLLLDDICDTAEDAVLQMCIENVAVCRPDAPAFADNILKQCEELSLLFAEFSKLGKNGAAELHIVKVNSLEEEGDRLHYKAMRKIHTDGTPLSEILCWKDIYNCLENCCDSCEKVADACEEVILKNS